MKQKRRKITNISAIDLFCGAGGLTHGLVQSGIDVRVGVDIEPNCQYPYEHNNDAKFLLKSVTEITKEDLKNFYQSGEIKLLAGCAPCQTFSKYNPKATQEDNRWWLLMEFARLVKELSPEIVTMENVPGLKKQEVFHQFVSELEKDGYFVSQQIVNCDDYGLPQRRTRLVLLASKLGNIGLMSPEAFGRKKGTVREAISSLRPLYAGEADSEDLLHRSASLSPKNLARIKASSPGGTWKDWPEELVANCHKKESGSSFSSVYGRMSWDKPSPTMTTQFDGFGNGRFGHPEQNRAISLREGAILQGFPLEYQFVPPGQVPNKTALTRMIGNAVPVLLGEVIGKSIIQHVKKEKGM